MSQRTLFSRPPADGDLSERQRLVYEAARERGGLSDLEAGALLHAGKHSDDQPCQWCARDGRGVLVALRRRDLVKRRRGGTWTLADAGAYEPAYDPATSEWPEGF